MIRRMPAFALLLAYDGGDFAGWWRQPGQRSVAGELDAACARLGEDGAAAIGASRTDASVHARGQVARLILRRVWTTGALRHALAGQVPVDLSCRAVAPVADGWHPVHDAVAKTYSYTIDNGAVADPFHRAFAWRPPFRLRLADLRRAAAAIPGQRDWQGFARRGDTRTDLVRRIDTVTWRADGDALVCTVTGASFTYRLVRSLVGAMVAVANGGCTKHDLTEALAGRRSPAGRQQAPAQGLCLERVRYDPELDWGG